MKLRKYLEIHKIGDAAFARELGVTRQSVWRYRNELVRPDWDTIILIRQVTGECVTAGDWESLSPTPSLVKDVPVHA